MNICRNGILTARETTDVRLHTARDTSHLGYFFLPPI